MILLKLVHVFLASIGRSTLAVALASLSKGGHLRVGMEDVLTLAKGVPVEHNRQLVERVVAIGKLAQRTPMSTSEARTFLGSGTLGGYALVNLRAQYDLSGGWELFARINNLFDRRFATAGQLGENPFGASGQFQTNSDDWTRDTFFAPGAPRAGWIGVRYRFKA